MGACVNLDAGNDTDADPVADAVIDTDTVPVEMANGAETPTVASVTHVVPPSMLYSFSWPEVASVR